MSNSAQAVKDKLKVIAKNKNIDFNFVLRFYMYDRFIERLSRSKYRDNFILKGGFYLSHLFGINNRSTMDIDAAIRNVEFSSENIVKMITEIIEIDVDDKTKFKIEKIESIRDEDEYGGIRVTIGFLLENIRDIFHVDIATGDPIYPGPINYSYQSLIGTDIYRVWSYNLETVIVEKIESILSKLESSSRMKDYYDIYLICKFKLDSIDEKDLRMAAEKTFKKRCFSDDMFFDLSFIKESQILRTRWASYARKNNYAKDIDFEECLDCLETLIKIISDMKEE